MNNFVFKCTTHEAHIIKYFPKEASIGFDRMKAEISSLRHAEMTVPGKVPSILEIDAKNRVLRLDYIEGIKGLHRRLRYY